jgi:hypothetical protein
MVAVAVAELIMLDQTDVMVDLAVVLVVTMDPQPSLVVQQHQVKEMLVVMQVAQFQTLVEVAVVVLVLLVKLLLMVLLVVTVVLD